MPRRNVRVFIADASTTYSGKTAVTFGRIGKDFNLRKNTKQFRKRTEALKFAKRKAKKLGVKRILLSANLAGTRKAREVEA